MTDDIYSPFFEHYMTYPLTQSISIYFNVTTYKVTANFSGKLETHFSFTNVVEKVKNLRISK